jgi:hypothetical protein
LRLDLELLEADPFEVTACLKRVLHYVETCRANAVSVSAVNKALVQIEELEVDAGEHLALDNEDMEIWKRSATVACA